ncbi:type II secretion system protein N [Rubrivivax gelatinosus]|uniref:Putative general secretion pathway protein C GspC n=1 Tax=Rubrivivax gelatinosus (strain NBRC 100245 / IL144) TaxID=983917 RepID=I0HMB0_RUBGI|nr:hypothetical protein [Rubrivivax gelatinosus]BAL94147.1 putative general secretion pathway protein C GspC [Rubrivivax gelatinosus IL144]
MTTRWWAFGVWAVVAASAVYWALRLVKPAPAPQATVVAAAAALRGDLSRVLGAAPQDAGPVESPESSRFALLGVVASRSAESDGVALIAVDGKSPKAYRVGTAVDGDTVVQSVRQREVLLGPRGGEATVSLDLSTPPPASTGRLPAPGAAAQPPARALALPGGALPQGGLRPGMPGRVPMAGQPGNADESAEPEVQSE